MRKSNLFELIREINATISNEKPIIVGSQAVHLVTNFPPDIVQQSIECDFLFTSGKSEIRAEVNKKFGVFSQFQIEHGFYADALGLATVILPIGWQERLQSLRNNNDEIIAYVADITDVAVSKLIAGREKDFIFINDLLLQEILEIEVFAERIYLVRNMPQAPVLFERLEKLQNILSKDLSIKFREFLKDLKSK